MTFLQLWNSAIPNFGRDLVISTFLHTFVENDLQTRARNIYYSPLFFVKNTDNLQYFLYDTVFCSNYDFSVLIKHILLKLSFSDWENYSVFIKLNNGIFLITYSFLVTFSQLWNPAFPNLRRQLVISTILHYFLKNDDYLQSIWFDPIFFC